MAAFEAAMAGVPRPAWSAAADEADLLVVTPPAKRRRREPAALVSGREVRGSRGRAMVARLAARAGEPEAHVT